MRPDRTGRHPWRRSFGQTRAHQRPAPGADKGRASAQLRIRMGGALAALLLTLAAVWVALQFVT